MYCVIVVYNLELTFHPEYLRFDGEYGVGRRDGHLERRPRQGLHQHLHAGLARALLRPTLSQYIHNVTFHKNYTHNYFNHILLHALLGNCSSQMFQYRALSHDDDVNNIT